MAERDDPKSSLIPAWILAVGESILPVQIASYPQLGMRRESDCGRLVSCYRGNQIGSHIYPEVNNLLNLFPLKALSY